MKIILFSKPFKLYKNQLTAVPYAYRTSHNYHTTKSKLVKMYIESPITIPNNQVGFAEN